MKLALISDVHGNLEGLEAVLERIDREDPGSTIVCAGDIVGYGADPEACINRLRERRALCVMGNHEEMVLGRRDFSNCVHAGIVAAMWTRLTLATPAREFLERLPASIEAAPGVIVCHGNLESADTYVSTPERAAVALGQLQARRPGASTLVCGHTHHAAWFTIEEGFRLMKEPADVDLAPGRPCLVNPGSTGQARDGKPVARYAVLDLEHRKVSFRQASYDYEPTLRKMRSAGLVAQVMLTRPQGFGRWVERWKTRWARFRAEGTR